MSKRLDLTGQKFNMLTVVEFSHVDKRHQSHWLCKCDCGNETIAYGTSLKSGRIKSCGCLKLGAGKLRRLDLTGKRFGKLTVIKFSHIDKRQQSRWLCKCDCGNEKIVGSSSLKSGYTKSCGCIKNPDLTGKRFGKLTVIKFSHADRRSYWLCKCDCGNEKIVSVSNLKKGATRSCGCLVKLSNGIASRNAVLARHKRGAEVRNLEQVLTDEQILTLHKQNCHYCGVPPSNIFLNKRGNGSYTYNGIDRKDSDIGYTINNSVSCCRDCNMAKQSLPYDEFLDLIKRIYEHLNLEGRP